MIPLDDDTIRSAGPDPLGILESCVPVLRGLTMVTIDRDAIASFAGEIVANRVPPPVWDEETHFRGEGPDALEQTAGWVFALDALNFCFWAQGNDPARRWRIVSGGETWDGYMALAIALRDAARSGIPVWDPAWQAAVDEDTIASLFAPEPRSSSIPLLEARTAHLRELGTGMLDLNLGAAPFTTLIDRCGRSAPVIARAVVEHFPSFKDIATWEPAGGGQVHEVRFHKRAQILASDLAGALTAEIAIDRVDQLTAFADYKVPQVLRDVGILRYRDDLAGIIRRRELIPPGSRAEVEIRATTVWGCELLRQELVRQGGSFTAAEVDWLLWNQGQSLSSGCEPYHRSVTAFY